MRRLALALTALILLRADMYPDASNAKLPEARTNLGVPYVSAKELGFVGDGTTVNTAALAAMFARADSPTVYFPAGTYLLPCPTVSLDATSAISIVGESRAATKWIYPAGCTGTTGGYGWASKSNWRIENLTIDFNNAASSAPTTTQWVIFSVLGFGARSENWRVTNVNFINSGTSLTPLGVTGHAYGTAGWSFDHNFMHQTTPNTLAIGGGLQVNESGSTNENIKITNNTFRNTSGMGLEVRNSIISGNDMSGWASGNAIVLYAGANGRASHNLISNNNLHDGAVTRDIYVTSSGGVENHSSYTAITGNLISRNGGGAVINFGKAAVISDNTAIDNGRRDDAGPDAAYSNAYVSAAESGDGAVFSNNTAIDSGATQFAVITGTATAADQLKLTFTGNITGSPVTVTYTATGGASLTAMAAGLAAAVNGNASLTAADINATSVLGVVTLNQPPALGAAITSSVTGAATETIEVLGSQRYCYAEPNTAVVGAATVYMGRCVPGKGGAMVRDFGIQPGTRIVPPPGERATVATLPVCNATAKYMTFSVSDQSGAPTYRGALTGGGALAVLAFCNGTSWEAH